jgi:gas vesicle protein
MERNGGNGLLAGLLFGTAIGIGLGLLYAPRTGAETRDMLRKRADEMKVRAETLGNSVREKVMMHPMGGNGSGESEA